MKISFKNSFVHCVDKLDIMKKLLLVLLTLLLVVSCSKDDNTSNSNTQTFLEKYDGFGFVSTTSEIVLYIFIMLLFFLKMWELILMGKKDVII